VDDAELRAAADAGDRSAMTALGSRAERAGADAEAWQWWRRAAFAGDEPAMRHLARALRRTDPDEAQLWRWHGVVAGKARAAHAPPAVVSGAAEALGEFRLGFGHGDRSPAEAGLGCGLLVVLGVAAAGVWAQLTGATAVAAIGYVVAVLGAIAVGTAWVRMRGGRHPGVWEYADGLDGGLTAARWAELTLVRTAEGARLDHPGGTLDLAPDAFPPGEQPVLVHRIGHHVPPGRGAGTGVS
jgi:hypothetical protein